jgi:hypothetical protein
VQTNICWATGYRVTRLQIPAKSDGVTLRDSRARFGVTMLVVQDASDPKSGFVPATSDRKLRVGELVVAVGRPCDLRRFAHALEGYE